MRQHYRPHGQEPLERFKGEPLEVLIRSPIWRPLNFHNFSSYLQALFALSHISSDRRSSTSSSGYLICLYFQFLSPFAVNALAAGIETEGGKPDDITVLLATVSL